MSNNTAVVTGFFRDVTTDGLYPAVRKHGSENFSWWICGAGDVTPMLPALSDAFRKHLNEDGLRLIPSRMICEGDQVAVEAQSDCTLRDGTVYRNTFCYWLTLSDGRITHLREYLDLNYGSQTIGAILADAFGAPA